MYIVAVLLYIGLLIWWAIATATGVEWNVEIWADSYQLMAIFGAIFGLWSAVHWGGRKSAMGRAIMAFSVGLLLQSFGQTVYGYYAVFGGIEVPYPSIGDIGFFGSIPCYIYGTAMLSRVVGARVSMKRYSEKISAVLIPTALLLLSYVMFLRGYDFAEVPLLMGFLDFGYPLGQAIYVSLAILVYFLSKKSLGGIMKRPLQVLMGGLLVQYIADYMFLYQSSRDTWYVGGINDLSYLTAYFVMTIALICIYKAFESIKSA